MERLNIKYYDISGLETRLIKRNEIEVKEGELKQHVHFERVRNREIVKIAKKIFMDRHGGRLFCEVCGFDFAEKYGEIGEGFIEAHHIQPVSEMMAETMTSVEDFKMVCSNCHSMLHQGTEWISCEDLQSKIQITMHEK